MNTTVESVTIPGVGYVVTAFLPKMRGLTPPIEFSWLAHEAGTWFASTRVAMFE